MKEDNLPMNRYLRALQLIKQEAGAGATVTIFLLSCASACGVIWRLLREQLFPQLAWMMEAARLPGYLAFNVATVLASLVVIFPIALGVLRWSYQVYDHETPLYDIFYYFRGGQYRRALLFFWELSWRIVFLSICCMLPSMVMRAAERFLLLCGSLNALVYSVILVLKAVLTVGGVLAIVYYMMRFFLAPYLLFDRPDLTPKQCIASSISLTKGNQLDLAMMFLSLMPLYLCSVMVIPLVFVFPYLLMLCSVRSRELLNGAIIA